MNLEKARTDSVGGGGGDRMALLEQGLNWKYHLNFAIIPKRLFSPFYRWGNWVSKRQKGHVQGPSFYRTGPHCLKAALLLLTAWVLLQSSPKDTLHSRGTAEDGRGGERRGGHPSTLAPPLAEQLELQAGGRPHSRAGLQRRACGTVGAL